MKKLLAYSGLAALALFSLNSCSKVDSDDLEEDVPYHQSYSVFFDVGSSRVDLQACKLEYSIVSPK